jgi:DNA repair protein RadA
MSKSNLKTTLQQLKSLTPKQVLKLFETNITSIQLLSEVNVLELKGLLNTTLNKANSILSEARKNLAPFRAYDGHDLMKMEAERQYLSTGCKDFDLLLGGKGFETGSISEIFAAYASGKSQIGFTCLVRAILPRPIGLDGSAIYIDTEGTLSMKRITQIAEAYKDVMPVEQVLKNMRVLKPLRSHEQVNIIKCFLENDSTAYHGYLNLTKPLKIIIVDSLTALFRAEYVGRGTLAERQQKLNEHLRDIYLFANQVKCVALITNQVMGNPDPFKAESEIAVGGNVLAHSSTYRISLRKRKNYRVATMVDSALLPVTQAMFKIARRGIVDLDYESLDQEGSDQVLSYKSKKDIESDEDPFIVTGEALISNDQF